MAEQKNSTATYDDDAIKTLSPREHIRLRPGMYIGKLGDGTQSDDGIYVLLKEVVDNSIDEFIMGAGKRIEITIEDDTVGVRDYGRGIPLKSLSAAVSQMNTGGKYGGEAFKKTVGLNGVGVKAVNMLSSEFTARSVRDGEARTVTFSQGIELTDRSEAGVGEPTGTYIRFRVDREIFGDYSHHNMEYVEQMVKNYTYLNLGLTITLNGKAYVSKNGLLDLVNDNISDKPLYEPVHLTGDDIEVVITHGTGYGEAYYSFVNGQYTPHVISRPRRTRRGWTQTHYLRHTACDGTSRTAALTGQHRRTKTVVSTATRRSADALMQLGQNLLMTSAGATGAASLHEAAAEDVR